MEIHVSHRRFIRIVDHFLFLHGDGCQIPLIRSDINTGRVNTIMFWRSGGPRGLQKKSSIVLAKEIRTSVSYIQRALFSPFLLSDVVTFAGGPRNLLNALECSVIFTRPPFFYLVSKHAQTFTHFFALSYRHFLLLHHSRPTPAQTTFQCPFSHPLISATVLLFFGNHQFDTTIYLGTQCQNIKA